MRSVSDGEEKRENYVELPEGFLLQTVEVPDSLHDKSIQELALRSQYHVHVLQLRHREATTGQTSVEFPGPDSRFARGDTMIVIGTALDIARLMSDLALTSGTRPR